ncbi:mucin-2 isoform X2 [Xenopus tropicalis]|uniref:Mucin-2 isoform X2 n=1 Tax=Xenopus tropicalis TaxID=8364 RepID=A0A8J1J6R7_XENTR|nr:mucin-2 isoform X2 [Xenopus tropicalis]
MIVGNILKCVWQQRRIQQAATTSRFLHLTGPPHWESTSPVTPVHPLTVNQKPQSDMPSTNHTSHSSMDISVKSSDSYHHMPTRSLGMPKISDTTSAPMNGMTKDHPDTNMKLTHTEIEANYSNVIISNNRIYTPNASTEPSHISTTEPSVTSGTEPPHTSGTEPPHTSGTEPPHTSGTEPPHTSGTEPSHTSGTEPSHTSGTEPSHTSGTEPPHTSGTEPPHTSGTEPPHTSGTEPSHTSGTEPPHTSGTEPPHTSGTEPPHTSGTEPSHTSGTEPSHTSGTEPPHTSGTEPPHTSSTEPPHTSGTEPSHTSGTEKPHTSGTGKPHTSAEPPGNNTERLHISSESPHTSTELLLFNINLPRNSFESLHAGTKLLYAGFDLLQSSTEHPSINSHMKGSTEPPFSGVNQPHKSISPPQTQLYSTEPTSNKQDSSNYMIPSSTDEKTSYANLVSPDTVTDSNSYLKSPFTMEPDLKISVPQTPDSELFQSPSDIQFGITHKGVHDSLGDITEVDSGLHNSFTITPKMRRPSINTAKKPQTFFPLSSTGIGDFHLSKAAVTVSPDEKDRETEDSGLGWAANMLGLSPQNTVSSKNELPVLSPVQTMQPKDTSNKEGELYHHVLQSERYILSHERENGVAGPNYDFNMPPVIDTDQPYNDRNSENAKDRGYRYSLISCIVGMLLCLSAMLYLLHKNRVLRRQLQRTQHDPEVPEQRPLQMQQFEV